MSRKECKRVGDLLPLVQFSVRHSQAVSEANQDQSSVTSCGYKLANDGHDTRAIQQYLGHKNITHTVRYTELASDRFKAFWRD